MSTNDTNNDSEAAASALPERNGLSDDQAEAVFLSSISHNIRTPLNAIVGYTDLLDLCGADDAKRHEYVSKIKGASEVLLEHLESALETMGHMTLAPKSGVDAEDVGELLMGGRVLLAEDNPLNVEITSEALQHAGFAMEWAPNGAECVKLIANARPGYYSAVLMDIQMPVMDGIEATRAIRAYEAENTHIPIIATTANAFAEDEQAAREAGMDAFLAKPIKPNELIDTLLSILNKGRW